MNYKVETWITRGAVVLYGLACLTAVVLNSQSKESPMKENTITEQVNQVQTNTSNATLLWLEELQEWNIQSKPSDFRTARIVGLTQEQLQTIICPKNYAEQGEAMTMAPFMPIAEIAYTNEQGEEICILLSFISCEYKEYADGNLRKEGMLTQPDEFYELLESIQ